MFLYPDHPGYKPPFWLNYFMFSGKYLCCNVVRKLFFLLHESTYFTQPAGKIKGEIPQEYSVTVCIKQRIQPRADDSLCTEDPSGGSQKVRHKDPFKHTVSSLCVQRIRKQLLSDKGHPWINDGRFNLCKCVKLQSMCFTN